MVYRIGNAYRFDAAHHLEDLPEGHKCMRPHGHTYVVEVTIEAPQVDPIAGWVMDYDDLNRIVKLSLDAAYDHYDLNAQGIKQPTAENIARLLFESLEPQIINFTGYGSMGKLTLVRVREGANTSWAEYQP